ncbi:hypothetical protein [Bartonella sp. B30(2025)]
MNIRYLFIAGAVTSSLALAIQTSDHKAIQKNSPVITNFTDAKKSFTYNKKSFTYPKKDLHFIENINGTFDNVDLVTSRIPQEKMDDFYNNGRKLIGALFGFLRSIANIIIQLFCNTPSSHS